MRDHRSSRRPSITALTGAAVLCGVLCPRGPAWAACNEASEPSNNLSLECLVDRTDGNAEPTLNEQSMYRSLVSELSGALTLPMAEPADTLGFNGFHFSFDTTFTTINQSAPYWSGRSAGVRKVTGPVLPVLSLMLRKGIWMPIPPLPSVELGFGASNLVNSDLFAINGYFKLAIHEGYHRYPIPSVAVRAAVTRLAGSSELDLTMITVDGVISKAFGAGGTFTLEPYLGGGVYWAIARSQVIDTNPTLDLYRGPVGAMNFDETARRAALAEKIVFPTQSDILRWRLFAGVHFHYSILALTAGFTYLGPGAQGGTDLTQPVGSVVDAANGQFQINFSAGVRF